MTIDFAELEARLRDQPNDTAAWNVYADALQQQNDPRGDVRASASPRSRSEWRR